jgi:hypothetical protein
MGSSTPAHRSVSFGFCLVVLHYPNFWELYLGPQGGHPCILVSAFLLLTVCPFSSQKSLCRSMMFGIECKVSKACAILLYHLVKIMGSFSQVHMFYFLKCILDQCAKFKFVTGLLSSVMVDCSLVLSHFILCQSVLFT